MTQAVGGGMAASVYKDEKLVQSLERKFTVQGGNEGTKTADFGFSHARA